MIPRFFPRLVAVFLVPCLIADPVTASAFSNPSSIGARTDLSRPIFQEQALSGVALALNERHPLLHRVPGLGRLLRRISLKTSGAPPLPTTFEEIKDHQTE